MDERSSGALPPDEWRRVKEVFSQALERPPAERAAYLDTAFGTEDAAVRREVEALLTAHEKSESFLQSPAAALARPLTRTGLAEGQTLGSYRVLRELGRGGMATVYLARDERHRRSVALKVLHPDLAHALGPERFLREIEVAANLSHPHILPLHDSGKASGLLYYVMPYVEGESLRDRLTLETQLPVDEALQLTREVADALAYAHGQGVIHRDIKPENILLTGGHALVADFGIAKALSAAGAEQLTETGMAVGTAAYMSPEQASAASHIDGRTDVYSLGCVLYEMLAGEPPYTGPTAQAVIAKRFTEPAPQVRRVRPSVPDQVEHAITRALAPVPADRFASAAEFARAIAIPTERSLTAVTDPAVPTQTTVPRAAKLGLTLALAALLVLIVVGGGVLWQRNRGSGNPSGPTRLAVLPFENYGRPEDEYFADGITDAVRGKLSALPALQVIARQSSAEYKQSSKSVKQIGQELGVQYLLTGTVRWEKSSTGSRVQVNPELVQATTTSTKWQQPFDAEMTNVFEVQGQIAEQVAQALDVALGSNERQELAEKPTQNLAAYDAYLRGEAAAPNLLFGEPQAVSRAAHHYAQAAALDSNFSQAWTKLSLAHSSLYAAHTPTPAQAKQALEAAQRARALAPTGGQGDLALGFYYLAVIKDNVRAAEEFKRGQLASPGNVDLLVGRALAAQRVNLDSALTYLRHAQILNPRSVSTAEQLAFTLLLLRRHPEAREAAERTILLAPSSMVGMQYLAMIALAQGDLDGARAVVNGAPKEIDSGVLLAFLAVYGDLFWLLDESQRQRLFELPLSAFDDDRVGRGLALAGTQILRGDQMRARAYADSARIVAEKQLQATPGDAQLHILYGLSLAYMGRKDEAIKEGRRGVALIPLTKDAGLGPYLQHQLVRIYLLVGEPENALDQLEPLLKVPYILTPDWLKIDPTFLPLRDNPRFERLVQGKT